MERTVQPEEVHAEVFQACEETGQHVTEEDAAEMDVTEEAVPENDVTEKDLTSSECSSEEGSEDEYLASNNGFSSSEEEEEEEEEERDERREKEEALRDGISQWRSKNGQILWNPKNEETLQYRPPSILNPGPTHYAVARISSPETAFDLFFNKDLLQTILRFTNLYGMRSVATWKELSMEELRAYMGLLILAGVYKSRHESSQSLWNGETGRAIFPATMSRKRFSLINRCLRFSDRQSRSVESKREKTAPIKKVWNNWTSRLPMMFNLGRDICIDEQLVGFRGRCAFRQYIPSKAAKYGLKIWALCDVETSYAWKVQLYTGKLDSEPREQNQGMRVVLDLTENLKGHTVTTDNFFTSFPLADALLKKKMALVGTIRANKPELPQGLLYTKERAVLSSKFAFTLNKTLVSYIQRKGKNVLLLSSKHREPKTEHSGKKKPQIILDYNHCKGAVDTLDHSCSYYSCRRQTGRWPMCLFFYMLDMSCYNAFVLFTSVDPSWNKAKTHKRRLFLEQLGRALTAPVIANRASLPRGQFAATLVHQAQSSSQEPIEDVEKRPENPKTRKQCGICQLRKRVCTQCAQCSVHACKSHLTLVCGPCHKEMTNNDKTKRRKKDDD